MNSDDAATWVSAAAAALSAAAALAALGTARAAGRAARDLTKIEAARRHQELTPAFTAQLVPMNNDSRFFHLLLELDGPIALERLRSLQVRIRDDRPGRANEPHSMSGNALSQEQIRSQVWGPLRFTPGVGPDGHGADQAGRAVDYPKPLDVGEGLRFQLEPTHSPWSQQDAASAQTDWRDTVGTRLRFTVVSHPGEGEPWVTPIEIDTTLS